MVLCMLPVTALASYTLPTESKYNLRQNAITFSVTLPNGSTVTDDIGRLRATDPITLGYQWGKDPCGTSYGWVLTINSIPVHAHWAGTGNIYRWVMTDKGVTGSTANSRQAYILYYASGVPAFVEGKQDQPPTVNGNRITFPPQGPDGGSTATLQVNTVITGDQTLTSNGTPFSVTVGTGYTPDDYKTGLDNSNYTYTFVKAERNSGTGLFKLYASSNGTTYTDIKLRQFFPASGANVVTVYYTAKTLMKPTPSADPTPTPSADPTPTPSADPTPTPSADPTPTPSADPTPTPNIPWVPGHDHNHNNNGVPPIVYIPPKTGDMPFWYSIAQFLGLVK